MLVLGLVGVARGQTRTAAAVVPGMVEAMDLVARSIVDENLRARIDDLVQRAPAAQRLGARWNSREPAFRSARSAITARIDRIGVAHAKSGDSARLLDGEVRRLGASADSALAPLGGPAGPGILKQQALMQFSASVGVNDPNAPRPGDPAFLELIKTLRARFEARVAPLLPKDDGTHAAEVLAYFSGPNRQVLSGLWNTVVGKATAKLEGAINLMMFDERAALTKEIDAAIQSVR